MQRIPTLNAFILVKLSLLGLLIFLNILGFYLVNSGQEQRIQAKQFNETAPLIFELLERYCANSSDSDFLRQDECHIISTNIVTESFCDPTFQHICQSCLIYYQTIEMSQQREHIYDNYVCNNDMIMGFPYSSSSQSPYYRHGGYYNNPYRYNHNHNCLKQTMHDFQQVWTENNLPMNYNNRNPVKKWFGNVRFANIGNSTQLGTSYLILNDGLGPTKKRLQITNEIFKTIKEDFRKTEFDVISGENYVYNAEDSKQKVAYDFEKHMNEIGASFAMQRQKREIEINPVAFVDSDRVVIEDFDEGGENHKYTYGENNDNQLFSWLSKNFTYFSYENGNELSELPNLSSEILNDKQISPNDELGTYRVQTSCVANHKQSVYLFGSYVRNISSITEITFNGDLMKYIVSQEFSVIFRQ